MSQAIPLTSETVTRLPEGFFNSSEAARQSFMDEVVASSELGFVSDIAVFSDANDGSLAKIAKPKGNGLIDIVKNYQWTITNTKNRNDIPYIELEEHKIEGGAIQKQFNFYAKGITATASDSLGSGETRGLLEVYDEIFVPNKTNFIYKLPYFSQASYELSTGQWQQFDSIGGSLSQLAGGLGKTFGKKIGDLAQLISSGAEATGAIAQTALQFQYPVVGIADRPRIFTAHNERSITVEFPLYNTTFSENSWKINKDFIQLFMGQNLFNKRNFITGLPPVWYKVTIPGVYYSVASCVTSFNVKNLGNTRMMSAFGKEFLVPDAYQVTINLQEMAMPSKNQFEYAISGINNKVESSTSSSQVAPPSNAGQPAPERNRVVNENVTPSSRAGQPSPTRNVIPNSDVAPPGGAGSRSPRRNRR